MSKSFRNEPLLTVKPEIIQFYIIKTFVIKRIFELILDIIQGDQNELTCHYYGISDPLHMIVPYTIDN